MNSKKVLSGYEIMMLGIKLFFITFFGMLSLIVIIPSIFVILIGIISFVVAITLIAYGKSKGNFVHLDSEGILKVEDVPLYTGIKDIRLNNDEANFTDLEISDIRKALNGTDCVFSKLDKLHRPSTATAILKPTLYNSNERIPLDFKPTGFINRKVMGNKWLYHRSHLIAYTFLNSNIDIAENLITGTKEFNVDREWGMLHYEDIIREYIRPYGKYTHSRNEILYQVTPIFRGSDMVAEGVQIRAKSLQGSKLDFNVFIYNVQDGMDINYSDGTSSFAKRGLNKISA